MGIFVRNRVDEAIFEVRPEVIDSAKRLQADHHSRGVRDSDGLAAADGDRDRRECGLRVETPQGLQRCRYACRDARQDRHASLCIRKDLGMGSDRLGHGVARDIPYLRQVPESRRPRVDIVTLKLGRRWMSVGRFIDLVESRHIRSLDNRSARWLCGNGNCARGRTHKRDCGQALRNTERTSPVHSRRP